MATTAQLRSWWSAYRCETSKYTYVAFPGVDREWWLLVAAPSAELWRAFAGVMTAHGYLFRESAGGTYNCRKIAGSEKYSLHAYAIALDLNPSKNPYNTSITDMPEAFRDDLKAIRTTQGTQAFTWGGDWSSGTDPMHWQLNVSPSDTELEEKDLDMLKPSRLGDTGPHVEALQAMLKAMNFYPGTVDGIYGSATSQALLACRQQLGWQGTSGDEFTPWAYENLHRVHNMTFGVPGPRGPKGDKGDRGAKGVKGEQGPPGPSPAGVSFIYE